MSSAHAMPLARRYKAKIKQRLVSVTSLSETGCRNAAQQCVAVTTQSKKGYRSFLKTERKQSRAFLLYGFLRQNPYVVFARGS